MRKNCNKYNCQNLWQAGPDAAQGYRRPKEEEAKIDEAATAFLKSRAPTPSLFETDTTREHDHAAR
jgi:hypothetical protein